MTFRIVNTDFTVMDVVRFLEDHSSRIESQKLSFDLFKIIDFQADVMKPEVHPHFAERGTPLKKRQIIVSVRNGNIPFWRLPYLFGTEELMIKVYERSRILSQKSDIAKCSHSRSLLMAWSDGVLECRSIAESPLFDAHHSTLHYSNCFQSLIFCVNHSNGSGWPSPLAFARL